MATSKKAAVLKEDTASTIHEAFAQAIKMAEQLGTKDNPNPYCWFRGVKDKNLKLVPGAYWRTGYQEYPPLVSFAQEGGAYAHVGELTNWDTYYLAQHHGIPTRLLDWTASFAAALFFALDGWDGVTEPCIWVLRPDELNNTTIGWSGIIAPNNFPEELGIWLPGAVARSRPMVKKSEGYTYDNRLPLAIYPKQSNARIVAQQGYFTVHGRNKLPLEDYLAAQAKRPVLGRIVLSGMDMGQARDDLSRLGVHRASIYPDIDNFVKGLKEQYGWQ